MVDFMYVVEEKIDKFVWNFYRKEIKKFELN